MSDMVKKPIKKIDMFFTYILGVVAQILTIIMWFFPTLKAEYFSNATMFVDVVEFDISLFSYNDQLFGTVNFINVTFFLLSILSLIWMMIPFIKGNVMKPHNMIFPTVFNFIYLVLFFVRYINAVSSYPLYDVSNTAVSVTYFFGILISFSVALSVVVCSSKLKKQFNQDTAENR